MNMSTPDPIANQGKIWVLSLSQSMDIHKNVTTMCIIFVDYQKYYIYLVM